MNKKVWLYGTIGAVSSVAIASIFTVNGTLAQLKKSDRHHPGSNPQTQIQSPSPSPEPGQMMGRDIDRHFIVMMIPHHQGAIDMAKLASTRAKRPEIKQLAKAIIRDQNREIEQMRTWYQTWYGSEVPDMAAMMGTSSGSHGTTMGNQPMMAKNSNRGMMAMHSMMAGNLAALRNADDFDREFIRQMIPHHQMAVMMAEMVLNTANKPEIRKLAQTIVDTQTAEINQMQQWQQAWFR